MMRSKSLLWQQAVKINPDHFILGDFKFKNLNLKYTGFPLRYSLPSKREESKDKGVSLSKIVRMKIKRLPFDSDGRVHL